MEFLIHWKCAKILLPDKSLFINQLELLSHLVVKQEVEALHKSYFKIKSVSNSVKIFIQVLYNKPIYILSQNKKYPSYISIQIHRINMNADYFFHL